MCETETFIILMSDTNGLIKEGIITHIQKICDIANISRLQYEYKKSHEDFQIGIFTPIHNEIRYMADHLLRVSNDFYEHGESNHNEYLKTYRHACNAFRISLPIILDKANQKAEIYHKKHRKHVHILVDTYGIDKVKELKTTFLSIQAKYLSGQLSSAIYIKGNFENVIHDNMQHLEEYSDSLTSTSFLKARIIHYIKFALIVFICIYKPCAFYFTLYNIIERFYKYITINQFPPHT